MPVLKVPVVHKFGIISHCQRLQLQSRLMKDINSAKSETELNITKRNQFEISDEFVEKYNSLYHSTSEMNSAEVKQLKDIALKFFLKIKRQIGVQHNCEDEAHLNLALGWTELAILSQCKGDISDKSLDLLCLSLSVAPIEQSTFLVQFYLLETALYFLQTSEFKSKFPAKHIKWLQIGELVALRIYVQCKLRISRCQEDNINNLKIYLKEFSKCYENFEKYPEAAISFCVIDEVSKYLFESFDNIETEENIEAMKHNTSSFLWHSCDLWQCSFYSSLRSQIPESIKSIEQCLSESNSFGNWIDCYLSFRILANIACFEKAGLETFESVIVGLSSVNSELVQQCPSSKVGGDEKDSISADSSREICGFQKGTILLFSAIREYSDLPLFSRTSTEKERSLSTIAEWLLHGENIEYGQFSQSSKMIMTSRLKATLGLLENTIVDSRITVIKNAIWSLLETVQRKQIMKGDLPVSLQYGKSLSSTIYSSDLSSNPCFINERLSMIFSKYLFPVYDSSPIEFAVRECVSPSRISERKSEIKLSNKRPQVNYPPKLSQKINNKPTAYIQGSNSKLNNILQSFWDADLPDLKKSIDEQVSITK